MVYLVTNKRKLFQEDSSIVITVEESLELLKPLDIIGLDTETTGLNCYTDKLLMLQLGCYDFQVVIDCSTIDILNYKKLLESNRLFIGWNLKFDLKWLFRYHIVPKNVWDGFLAEKLMWLGYPAGYHSMSLKSAGEGYLGIELDKSVRGKVIYQGLTTETIEYAANDVKYLEEIMNKQKELLKEKSLSTAIIYENKFLLPLSYCEYCGVKLDVDKWKAKMLKDELRVAKALENCNKWLLENEPDSPYIYVEKQGDLFFGFNTEPQVTINWNSAQQVATIFKKYDVNIEVQDKSNGKTKNSIDAKCLKPQKDKCSLIPLYLDYKEAIKVTTTYGQNFLDQINPISHRIHTNYTQLGADTTRITSGGKDKANNTEYVNLLNLPKDAETRGSFVAEKGNKWISIDYSGQETYLMASIANDKAIIKELTEGSGDIHSLTAYMSYSEIPRSTPIKDIKKLYHSLRQEAKGIEFAINYGGNADTISRNKGIPLEEANKIYNDYMAGFSGLRDYQAFRRKDWWDKGYILLNEKTGHKAYIPDWEDLKRDQESFKEPGFWEHYREMKKSDPECYTVTKVKNFFKKKSAYERSSINYPIQATGSMCLRVSLINFFEYLRNNNLLFKVLICITPYDECNIEAPEEIADDIAKQIHKCMIEAGAYFCTRCKLDADISYDENGELPNYWIH